MPAADRTSWRSSRVKCSDQALICREPGDRPGDTSTSPPCAHLPAGSATSACWAANRRPGRRRPPALPDLPDHRDEVTITQEGGDTEPQAGPGDPDLLDCLP